MPRQAAWLAVVGEVAERALARSGWRTLPLIETPSLLAPGDGIVVVRARRTRSIATATVIGTAIVREARDGADLAIRHRVIVPEAHEIRLVDVPVLVRRVGWTDDRLRALAGSLAPIPMREFTSVDGVLHETALAFGPPPKRKAHARPRTPGRRRLATARIAARRGAAS